MEPVYTPVIWIARGLFAAQGLKFTITGAKNIPTSGGAVLMSNHLSYFDFAYAGLAAVPSRRLVRFMAKDDVFRHKISGPLMRGMHHIPVDRTAGAASFRAAVSALKAGEIVGVFPEATISRSFELKGFKSGAVRMAQAAGVPIVHHHRCAPHPDVRWRRSDDQPPELLRLRLRRTGGDPQQALGALHGQGRRVPSQDQRPADARDAPC